jgi:uncharacterized membrane protein
VANLIHVMLAVIWVGGMFFAYIVLRPVAGRLEAPERLRLWAGVFHRFFIWVWVAVVLTPLSGYWLGMTMYGSPARFPLHVHVMQGLGWLMVAVFLVVYVAPYRVLVRHVRQEAWPAAGAALQNIRRLVALNLTLGLLVVASASAGRFFVLF